MPARPQALALSGCRPAAACTQPSDAAGFLIVSICGLIVFTCDGTRLHYGPWVCAGCLSKQTETMPCYCVLASSTTSVCCELVACDS